MRTSCQRVSTSQQSAESRREDRALTPLSEEGAEISTQTAADLEQGKASELCDERGTLKSETKKKNKSEQIAERHPKKHKRGKGPPGNPPSRQQSNQSSSSAKLPVPLSWETSKTAASGGKIVLFVGTLFLVFLFCFAPIILRCMTDFFFSIKDAVPAL